MPNLILDVSEISNYEDHKLNVEGGLGNKAHNAMSDYTSRLGRVVGEGFNPNDTSTAHAVLEELKNQMLKISEITDDLDRQIDDLVYILNDLVIQKENKLSDSVLEH